MYTFCFCGKGFLLVVTTISCDAQNTETHTGLERVLKKEREPNA